MKLSWAKNSRFLQNNNQVCLLQYRSSIKCINGVNRDERSDGLTSASLMPPGVKILYDRLAQAVIVKSRAEGTPGIRLQHGSIHGTVEFSPPEIGSEQRIVFAYFQHVVCSLWGSKLISVFILNCLLKEAFKRFWKFILRPILLYSFLPAMLLKSLISIYEFFGAILVMLAPLRTTGITLYSRTFHNFSVT